MLVRVWCTAVCGDLSVLVFVYSSLYLISPDHSALVAGLNFQNREKTCSLWGV